MIEETGHTAGSKRPGDQRLEQYCVLGVLLAANGVGESVVGIVYVTQCDTSGRSGWACSGESRMLDGVLEGRHGDGVGRLTTKRCRAVIL